MTSTYIECPPTPEAVQQLQEAHQAHTAKHIFVQSGQNMIMAEPGPDGKHCMHNYLWEVHATAAPAEAKQIAEWLAKHEAERLLRTTTGHATMISAWLADSQEAIECIMADDCTRGREDEYPPAECPHELDLVSYDSASKLAGQELTTNFNIPGMTTQKLAKAPKTQQRHLGRLKLAANGVPHQEDTGYFSGKLNKPAPSSPNIDRLLGRKPRQNLN